MDITHEIRNTALAVYDTYKRNIAVIGGDYRFSHDKDWKHWASTAEVVLEYKADPVKFVTAQFAGLAPGGRLAPKCLYYPKQTAVNRYHDWSPEPTGINYENFWRTMCARVEQTLHYQKETYAAPIDVILCPLQVIPAWFRILYLERLSDVPINKSQLVTDLYLDEAIGQVRGNRNLNEFIQETDYATGANLTECNP